MVNDLVDCYNGFYLSKQMSHAKLDFATDYFIPKYNYSFNIFLVHSLISCVQHKLMKFVYL